MKIGLTYDLRSEYLQEGYGDEETAEFDRPDTIDSLEAALQELGFEVDRIGRCKSLVNRLAVGDRWDLVFNICEGLHGVSREAQVPALLDLYEIPYTFADPRVMSVCLHKQTTKTLVAAAGVPTPQSLVVHQLSDLDTLFLNYPLFAKPVAQGTSKGVTPESHIRSTDELVHVCECLLSKFHEPVLVEEYLPGREFTVGILGTGSQSRVLGTLEIVMRPEADSDVYSYRNKEDCESLVDYRLVRPDNDPQVAEAEELALVAWRALDARDAGRIDLRCDAAGRPQFIEANPLAGLHPTHSDLPMLTTALGMSYQELIAQIVRSALARVNTNPSVSIVQHV
ncbi:MAG: D-alanine--D-alanine ligase [Planctomycetaceae bacterium]